MHPHERKLSQGVKNQGNPSFVVQTKVIAMRLQFQKSTASVVRYSVLNENEQLFASKDRLVFPSEEELRSELDRERSELTNRVNASNLSVGFVVICKATTNFMRMFR
jgi:hypothetical protein